ncbi:glycosyltransferase family 2 protein [Parabacteroides distasonis]|uniref:glycosyltransferase family 2 protein n=1 Tax=Parabacteroides distasonis TaxID=823 RepID=UPI001C3D4924|nr:glycosyltransferase family 2 protein [Parabacteroides distasonis]MCR1852168.1 glycosyltransferase [Parabacteroides distasonis]MCX4382290.1 glycosyltransferase family 2 protein [Parabacteroides distasonis]
MKEGLVSIITPVYNGEKYISETIESVIKQTYLDWEMIVVDDGSKDGSAAIVRRYAEKESRITLLQQPNGGSASARNNGIRYANGQYIALLDSDDLWDPDFLKSQLVLMKEKNTICVHGSYKRINENSEEILKAWKAKKEVTYKQMQMTNHIACLTGLYDTSKFGKIYLKEELRSIRDDYAYWLDVVKLAGVSYGNQDVLASYRVISSSTTGKKKKLIRAQFYFYYHYQRLGLFKSILYTMYWGILGVLKFSGKY